MTRRFLFTGSQSWADPALIVQAILAHMQRGDILVHGNAEGLDKTAAQMWEPFGPVESYPAADFETPLLRNLHMISLGADACLAFALKWRSGTGHCARHARKAGIPTFDYGVDTRIELRG
ncbi:MAG: hypothetical protein WC054_00605 [Candidatus Nanopelagicales bacterium]